MLHLTFALPGLPGTKIELFRSERYYMYFWKRDLSFPQIMQTVTVEITNENALRVLQQLQEKHFINIIAKPDISSPVFPGTPLSEQEFQNWISSRENNSSVSLKEAKGKWAKQRKQLLKSVKLSSQKPH